ncbi:Damage response protein 1 [Verticillium dahliae VDG1]|nr:Damage response protein 1 [Verticillium dahliae VDG1]
MADRARSRSRSPRRDRDRSHRDKRKKKDKAPRDKVAPAPSGGEEYIIVHVNDRLGTKVAIPCLASDPVKMFKIMVAARVGRKPHEILLKRQGERPFKDQLTLEDYGVSNGVQLDLEVDTGD